MDIQKIKKDIVFRENLRGSDFVFHSTWGLFSPRAVDKGTKVLIDQLVVNKYDKCLDLGCGYGQIGVVMAKLAPEGKICLVDKDFVAVKYAKKNVELNGLNNCEVLLSNAFSHLGDKKFDLIASNLPANVGKELLYIILSDAYAHLNKGGRLYVVTIAGLRKFIKRYFVEVFGNYKKVKQSSGYAVALAVKSKKRNGVSQCQ